MVLKIAKAAQSERMIAIQAARVSRVVDSRFCPIPAMLSWCHRAHKFTNTRVCEACVESLEVELSAFVACFKINNFPVFNTPL